MGNWRTGGFKLGKITFALSAVLESQRSGLSRSGAVNRECLSSSGS